ncbi:MAG: hypothetical protein H3C26_15785 [Rhodocyclaceae bacterium]|nr:hypothetical protein [Rhodocyclaceae bacterium]
MNYSTSPHLHPCLTRRGEIVTRSGRNVRHLFGNDHAILLKSLEDIESVLADARQEHEERCGKVAELTEYLENLEAIRLLKNQVHSDVSDHLRKLGAEAEMRDRLAWAIRGLERAIEWRKENPLLA